ncbi:endopeptidase La [Geobacter sp. DSM 9736]|uniref:endopeptidase La n=1 Tax=Geobacter sp. DSM 9736 TaxID=1277350 RepID=UPI000B5DF349|nr:endopeptidase La [Geobacter sp. DSM 9736]SNB47430.1 ATP-dependent proteinase. Serine peptidase. MEROPS family S16 [Geobacter sp. DSM 9736]
METKPDTEELKIPEILPLLPVRDVVVYPYMILPLFVGREISIAAVDHALSRDRLIFLATQKDVSDEDPAPEAIYDVGTVAMIMRMLKLPDGRVKILVQGLTKGHISEYISSKPFYSVRVDRVSEPATTEQSIETEALIRTVKEQLTKIISLGKVISPEVMVIVENMQEPGSLADLIASNIGLKVEEAQRLLEIIDPLERLKRVNEFLNKEYELLNMQARIQSAAKEEMGKSQREYFLREQLRAIQQELGETDARAEEMAELRKAIDNAKMPPNIEKEALKQLGRLEQMHPDSAESGMLRTFMDWMVDLPWSKSTKDILDIPRAKEILDEDHYYLEKIKERILEFLAVRKLKKKMKGPILCFVGPPGVGKTSLGKSIARAMGRKFVRISLGGVRDEAEIRGHRRTYVGALPGRILQGLKQAGANNPVFMLDELDKIGADFRGDPSSALLEVLDPEQNHSFSDHYINLPFNLSNVMFIATANQIDPVPGPLRDRMEVITLSGYTEEEKLEISKRYIVPRQIKENGITDEIFSITDDAIKTVIGKYTREAGLRNLEREIGSICRKVARRVAEGEKRHFKINSAAVPRYLGPPRYLREEEMKQNEVGVATGLAWTPVGGEVLFVESTIMKGKGGLTLTGQLGDVMKESVQAALSYIRSKETELGLTEDFFHEIEIHVHVPAGAIPKDGPSAGITMATALISALTKTPVRKEVAMTGEITLRGKVLPIGGLKEKILAAIRAGVTTVIIPEQNRKDLEDIPRHILKKIKVVTAKTIDDVLAVALEKFPPAPTSPGKTNATKGKPTPRRVVVTPRKGVVVGAKQ